MLENLINSFMEIKKEPVGFGVPGVKLIGSSHYSKLLEGDFHMIYFGDTQTGTHKDGLADTMLDYAQKKGHKYLSVISSGSYNIALHGNILKKQRDIQLFELVDYNVLKGKSYGRGYSIDKIVRGKNPYLRVRIGAPLNEKILSKREIEKIVAKRIKKNKNLQKALNLNLGLFQSVPILDITNPHDTVNTTEPLYEFDPALLANYDYIISPGGTLNLAYSVQCALNKLDEKNRPNLIVVTPRNHPILGDITETKKQNGTSLSKLETPYLSKTAVFFEKLFHKDKDWIYSPNGKYIKDAYTEAKNMSQKTTHHHRFHLLDYQSVFKNPHFVAKLFRGSEHLGFETKRKGIKYLDVEVSSCAPLTVLQPEFKEAAKKIGKNGLLIPYIHYSPFDPKEFDMLIPSGSRVLGIVTGQSKGIRYVRRLAKRIKRR